MLSLGLVGFTDQRDVTLSGAFVLTRLEGGLLLGLFIVYTGYLLRGSQNTEPPDHAQQEHEVTRSVTARVTVPGRDIVFLLGGLLVLVSGDYVVFAASALARSAGLSEWIIR